MILVNDFVKPQEVRDELNIIEELQLGLSSDDEYLEAILENQKLVGMMMLQMMEDRKDSSNGNNEEDKDLTRSINRTNLPEGYAGIVTDDVKVGESGEALFSVLGSTILCPIYPRSEVDSGEVVVVNNPNNQVRTVSDIERTDIVNVSDSLVQSGDFDVSETEDPVTIEAGEEKTILSFSASSLINWWEVGATDNQYSNYQYYVDGEPLFSDWMDQPLGLYNDLYKFPKPVRAQSTIEITVRRGSVAPGPEEYVGKIITTK